MIEGDMLLLLLLKKRAVKLTVVGCRGGVDL